MSPKRDRPSPARIQPPITHHASPITNDRSPTLKLNREYLQAGNFSLNGVAHQILLSPTILQRGGRVDELKWVVYFQRFDGDAAESEAPGHDLVGFLIFDDRRVVLCATSCLGFKGFVTALGLGVGGKSQQSG